MPASSEFRASPRAYLRIVDPSETLNFAGAGFLVEPLRIPFLADFDRGIDEHFDEIARLQACSNCVAVLAIRADERGQSDRARLAKQIGHSPDAADILFAILSGKAQPEPLGEFLAMPLLEQGRRGVQTHPHVVAVQHKAPQAAGMELVVATRFATVLLPQAL